mgnify:CR=1
MHGIPFSRFQFKKKIAVEANGPITWSIFYPGVELSSVNQAEISALGFNTKTLLNQMRDYMAKFSTQG